jgi:hypothetical protein
MVCEAIGTAAIPGLLYQPRVIVKMIVEKQMECRLAGGTEVLGENLLQRHFCPLQNPTWPDPGLNPGRRGGKPATNLPELWRGPIQTDYEECKAHEAEACRIGLSQVQENTTGTDRYLIRASQNRVRDPENMGYERDRTHLPPWFRILLGQLIKKIPFIMRPEMSSPRLQNLPLHRVHTSFTIF